MQNGPVFGNVDFLTSEHGVDPRSQIRFLRQLHQQVQRFVGDAVLRVIEV